jgi:hypothetical protein
MTVNTERPQIPVIVSVYNADGSALQPEQGSLTLWSRRLFATQDYIIEVHSIADYPMDYTLQVTITGAQSEPKRITFQPGSISVTALGSTATPGTDRFVLRALAGQIMTVAVSSPQNKVTVIIYGADGNFLVSRYASETNWSGNLPITQDYYSELI